MPSVDSPLMRQYLEVKEKHPDCLIFFRVGDFYELFFDDAVKAARALDLTLTSRDKGKEDQVPMAGVPHHAVRQYVSRAVEQGFKVALCDQVEDAKLAKGLVRREVTRIVTPGVILDEEQLDARSGCYLAAVVPGAGAGESVVGLAWLDVSTGEFAATELGADEIDQAHPAEQQHEGEDRPEARHDEAGHDDQEIEHRRAAPDLHEALHGQVDGPAETTARDALMRGQRSGRG